MNFEELEKLVIKKAPLPMSGRYEETVCFFGAARALHQPCRQTDYKRAGSEGTGTTKKGILSHVLAA